MKSKQKIYLIGLPGTGKSYFGKVLSHETGIPFYDLDQIIEEEEQKKIEEIFKDEGEEYFRELEADLLETFSNRDQFILATGGGAPCFFDGIDVMNEDGITVYLKQKREILIERLSRSSHRPLMKGDVEKKVDELLSTRSQFYEQADIIITHRDPEELLVQIDELELD